MLTASRDRNAGLQPAGPLSTAESANEKLDHHLPVVDVVMQTTDPVSTVEAADPVTIAEPTSEKSFRDLDLPVVDVVMQISTIEAADPVTIAEPTSEKSFRDVDLPVVDVVMQTTDPVSTVEAACGFRFIRGFCAYISIQKVLKGSLQLKLKVASVWPFNAYSKVATC